LVANQPPRNLSPKQKCDVLLLTSIDKNLLWWNNILQVLAKHILVFPSPPNCATLFMKETLSKETQHLDMHTLQDTSTMYFSQIEWVGDF
jgi:hypothetical protein